MKSDRADLEDLIRGCMDGDPRAQEAIFKRLYGKMMGVVMRYARDHEVAKDLVQEGFIKVFEKIGVYNFKGSFEGWVRRIIVNNAIDHVRKKKREFLVLDDEETYDGKYDDTEEEEDNGFYASIKPQMVVKAIAQLSPSYKLAFNMYVVEGYTHKEIAEELDISIGTSKSNLAKAKYKLKKILLTELNNNNE